MKNIKKFFIFVLIFVGILSTLFVVQLSNTSGIIAYAESDNDIRQGDRDSLTNRCGSALDDNFDIEIIYKDYTLYSSGLYAAFEINFDGDFLTFAIDENESNTLENMLNALGLLFYGRGYELKKDKENAQFVAAKKYATIADMYIELGIDGYDNTKSTAEKSTKFLFNDYKNTKQTVFSYAETENTIIKSLIQLCYQFGTCRENILLKYMYGTPYKIVKTDADTTQYLSAERIYVHTYSMTMDNYDKSITLTQTTPNAAGWYTLAIVASLLILAIPLWVAIRKRGDKNGKN